MNDGESGQFFDELERVAKSKGAEGKWTHGKAKAYWFVLQLLALEDVVAGIRDAAAETPRWMPSADLIKQHAIKHEKARKLRERRNAEKQKERVGAVDLTHVPTGEAEAQMYIDAATDKYERFARECEVESKQLELDGRSKPPDEVSVARSRKMRELIFSVRDSVQERPDEDA